MRGVALAVQQGANPVVEARTDDQGVWRVPVPGPGTYTVRLDVETLPKGIRLRDEKRRVLDAVDVRPGQQKFVLFPIGEAAVKPGIITRVIDRVPPGLTLGLIVALAGVGLSLIFGVTGLVNFAHGELVTFGAMVAFLFSSSAAGPEIPLVPAAAAALVAGGLLGVALEVVLWRPLRRRRAGTISLLVVAIGLSLLLRHLILVLFKSAPRPYDEFTIQQPLDLGPFEVVPKDLVIMGVSAAALVLMGLLLQRTRTGKAIRAVADNKDLAESSGIDVDRVILTTWVVAGALAALGGVFYGVNQTVRWDMGYVLLLTMFAAVILGGLGTAYGAIVGGLLIGLASETSTASLPEEFKTVIALGVLIVVLLIRPQGILGVRERIG